ncbi:unnamed protein product [Closterium sp. Yama58-4]|nr:unnamed protein product [Closterium sp. Yama58-4]
MLLAEPASGFEPDALPGWLGDTYRSIPNPKPAAAEPEPGLSEPRIVRLSWKPRAWIYKQFLTHEECDHIIELARHNLTRSEVVADNGTEEIDTIRTSYGTFLETAQDDVIKRIEDRIASWTFLPPENQESMQVLRYAVGQKYDAHHDFFDEDEKKQQGGHRYATVLMYLTDGFSGGETVFPDSEKDKQEKDNTWSECGKQGVAAKPVKGDALLFFSLKPSAEPDLASLHAGCPVLAGEKWSATKWIHVRSFEEENGDDEAGNEGGSPSKKSHPPGACVDESEHCPLWAKGGECEKNPGRPRRPVRLATARFGPHRFFPPHFLLRVAMDACADSGPAKRAEIYTYEAPWPVYSMNWSVRPDKNFRLAVGSFIEDYRNKVEIVQLDDNTGELRSDPRLTFDHPYPPTKLMFVPGRDIARPDLLATSGDFLRIWQITDDGVRMRSVLNNNKNSEFCAPLTSFDWNESEPRRLGTSSIDTTCTIWDMEKEVVDTQLIAHDKEVYDIAWGGVGLFASVSADGSVRVFDLRDKEHSTIIYESPQPETPLLRLGWNKQDPRYMATILMDSPKVVILDIRFPTLPVAELQRHQACVNAIAWAPHSSCHICTAGDDSQALIWDLSTMTQPVEGGLDPILAYTAGAEINQLQWSSLQHDWVAIAYATKLQILRV